MSNILKENLAHTTRKRTRSQDTNECQLDFCDYIKQNKMSSRLPSQSILDSSTLRDTKDNGSNRYKSSWFEVTAANNSKKPNRRKRNSHGGLTGDVERQNANLRQRIVNAKPVVSTNTDRLLKRPRLDRPGRLRFMKNVQEPEIGTFMPERKRAILTFDKLNKRGFLLIINFMFSDEKERKGSDEDVGNLCKFFTKLKYDIHCRSDLTTQELKLYFEHVRHTYLSRDSSEYHCFICVIMSHGNEKGISTKDGFISIDDVVHYFRNDVLTQFLGKPKIFIFQACRGKEIQQKQGNNQSRQIIQHDSSALLHKLPTDADIFRIFATSPGR
ncbi:unnamed protein product [Mytilus coruscus]|uniref:Caspase family p20 domain-containing protein n=1 Tax=Mytilus coruscus TaxID=42192 RepID=A0A6J8D980_MYTCO|nr:unnamed protein product [Mytilus coruscus]